ncbi:DUF4227 family protein [Paenibacillus tengchongensis]|uniref:DUF4227 family protein n=1 Tax=Paenibacillus tengchongensis TaxID=2608684 RepID=UPI001651D372|nr:DUF4227 family protein [Paenibacillus tengchongensis]
MIISVPKTVRRLYFLTLLVALSCLFYYLLSWAGAWLNPLDRQEIPEGTAVRAFQYEYRGENKLSPGERLRLYYWLGE